MIEVGPSQEDKSGEANIYLNVDHHQRTFVFQPELQAGAVAVQTLSKEEIAELAIVGDVRAPFKANICEISVKEGEEIAKGDRVAMLEAMKRQTPVLSEVSGTVASVSAKIGQAMQPGDKILKVDPAE